MDSESDSESEAQPQSSTKKFLQFIEKLFQKSGWGSIFPTSIDKWIADMWAEEETGVGTSWPVKSMQAIIHALKKGLSVLNNITSFFFFDVVIGMIMQYFDIHNVDNVINDNNNDSNQEKSRKNNV